MNSRFSDAALAYWAKVYPGNNLRIPTISTYDAALAAFDAGVASVTPYRQPERVLMLAEIKALPKTAILRNCRGENVSAGTVAFVGGGYEPYTLVYDPSWQPAPVPAEPVPLTDPDDPRIRVGALVQSDSHDSIGYSTVIYRYLLDDKPTVDGFICGTVAYVRAQIAGGSKNYSLLAEAPTPDPDDDEPILNAMRVGGFVTDQLAALRAAGYDVVKVER